MHQVNFQPGLDEDSRQLAKGMVEAVLRAADPSAALKKRFDHSAHDRPTHILAFGKASIPMAGAAIECLGERFVRATVLGPPDLCVQSDFKSKEVDLLPVDHPLPSKRNIEATQKLVEHARDIPGDHDAIVLISGGGSAMLCSPRPRVTLEQIVQTTDDLIRAGAPIGELNAQRIKLETLKGGGLARELSDVRQVRAYVLSDVVGDDLGTIASGPLVDGHPPTIEHTIIASNGTAIDALCAFCAHEGFDCVDVRRRATGESAQEGQRLAGAIVKSAEKPPFAAVVGGETTVNVGQSDGVGGPALELGLAAGVELCDASFPWMVLSLTTDGVDGPTDAAGSVLTPGMFANPASKELAHGALENHDALTACDALGAAIQTGPTGTNINDVAIAVRWTDASGKQSAK